MQSDKELLPCPFCGSAPHVSPAGDGTGVMIECTSEGCVNPHTSWYGDGLAARAWNTRALLQGETGNVEHASDCALHNAPALPVGPCDCGATPELYSESELRRAEDLLSGEPDTEDCERFASRYGSQLVRIARHAASQGFASQVQGETGEPVAWISSKGEDLLAMKPDCRCGCSMRAIVQAEPDNEYAKPLYLSPQSPRSLPSREEVARLIDPEAWEEYLLEDGRVDEEVASIFQDAYETSLAKASQILSLLSVSLGGGKEDGSSVAGVQAGPVGPTEPPIHAGNLVGKPLPDHLKWKGPGPAPASWMVDGVKVYRSYEDY